MNVGVGEGCKVGFLWKVLADKAVGVFDGPSLPGRIWAGKEAQIIMFVEINRRGRDQKSVPEPYVSINRRGEIVLAAVRSYFDSTRRTRSAYRGSSRSVSS